MSRYSSRMAPMMPRPLSFHHSRRVYRSTKKKKRMFLRLRQRRKKTSAKNELISIDLLQRPSASHNSQVQVDYAEGERLSSTLDALQTAAEALRNARAPWHRGGFVFLAFCLCSSDKTLEQQRDQFNRPALHKKKKQILRHSSPKEGRDTLQ